MTRTANVKTNLIFNTIKFTTQLILQFAIRTALIYLMGAEYLGLNGLFSNVLAFLNLAEVGIGTAIVFNMYKPITENDTEKIKALQNLYKKFYLVISSIVLVLGVAILPFIKHFINGDVSLDINIYVIYFMYLVNTLVGYLAAHKRSLLFAYQRNDIENKIKTFCLFFMTAIQIVVLFAFKNYYAYFAITIVFTAIESLLISKIAKKLYPQLNGKAPELDIETKKEIKKNIGALSLHKIGSTVVFSTDNILISTILGLTVLGAYSNYVLIISTITSLFVIVSNAIGGSVGNLVASLDKKYVYVKYNQIKFILSFLTAISTVCMIVLFQPFIRVWTGGGIYVLELSTVILLVVSFYFSRMRMATSIFKDAAGLFWQNRFAPIFEAIINLVVSIVLGWFMGINGIIIGTILSTVLVPLWVEPKMLYKHYFKKSMRKYFIDILFNMLAIAVATIICYFICSFIPECGILWLIVRFVVCIILCIILLLLIYCKTKDFKSCVKWLKEIMHNFKSNKPIKTPQNIDNSK
ncbi:MAG: transporter [Clostridia bacterium]|nr:transporter [Clostridia bacterium]